MFQEYTGIRKTFSACVTTYLVLIFTLFFYRQENISRIFFGLSALLLFVLTLLSRLLFRMSLRGRFGSQRRVRVLMVGADDYAWRIASRLRRVPFATLEVVGHVRLPGQEVAVKELSRL